MKNVIDYSLSNKKFDYKNTKMKLKEIVKYFRICEQRIGCKIHPSVTANYKFDIPNFKSNIPQSSTEEAVLYRVEGYKEDLDFINKVNTSLNNLDELQKKIIWKFLFNENLMTI